MYRIEEELASERSISNYQESGHILDHKRGKTTVIVRRID